MRNINYKPVTLFFFLILITAHSCSHQYFVISKDIDEDLFDGFDFKLKGDVKSIRFKKFVATLQNDSIVRGERNSWYSYNKYIEFNKEGYVEKKIEYGINDVPLVKEVYYYIKGTNLVRKMKFERGLAVRDLKNIPNSFIERFKENFKLKYGENLTINSLKKNLRNWKDPIDFYKNFSPTIEIGSKEYDYFRFILANYGEEFMMLTNEYLYEYHSDSLYRQSSERPFFSDAYSIYSHEYYNSNGLLVKYREHGEQLFSTYKYNDANQIMQFKQIEDEFGPYYYVEYKYDRNGCLEIAKSAHLSEHIQEKDTTGTAYYYNGNCNPVKKIIFKAKGEISLENVHGLTHTYKYAYDDSGNWIKRIIIDRYKVPLAIYVRDIRYFE